jgi:predicted nuclease with TOPRIM domain
MTNPKIETDIAEILKELQSGQKEILKEIVELKSTINTIDKRLIVVETRLDEQKAAVGKIPELAEKVGELKNWRQIAVIIITGTASTVFGWFLRSGRY